MPDSTPTPPAEWLVYCTDPTFGFIEPDGSRCYILEKRSPQQVKRLGYRFTADLATAWKFPTQAQALHKAIIVNRHIGWSSQGLQNMSTMPASQFPPPASSFIVDSLRSPAGSLQSSVSVPSAHPSSLKQHGGARTPGPGKTNGRPKKKPKDKAVTTTITLSSPRALKALKRLAKRHKITPGALIEDRLELSTTKLDKLKQQRTLLSEKILKAHSDLDLVKVEKLMRQQNLLEAKIANLQQFEFLKEFKKQNPPVKP